MTLLRSLAFNLLFWGWTAIIVIGCLPTLLGPPRWAVAAQRTWAAGSLALARVLTGIRIEVRGTDNLPDGPFIVASKHQSTFETMFFSMALDKAVTVLKKELLGVPFYGWYARKIGMIPIDRKGSAGAMRQMLRMAESVSSDGRPIVIFPEGSRAPAGGKLPYQPGAAGLYRHLGVPVVPVALNSGIYWPRRRTLKFPGTIVVEYLPPILPGLDRPAFMEELEVRIESATADLLEESGFSPVDK